MKAQFLKYWDRLRSSFWFLPALMAIASVALAFIAGRLDETVTDKWLSNTSWVYSGGAEGASAVLSVIAGSMMTIAGVVFSMTLVAMTLASSQFGPRLLRNFMRDTRNQLVLGTFVATFLYCLLVLRTIRRGDAETFVPHLSVTIGVVFAMVGIGVLIYFIHHVSVSIQADEIVARVGDELNDSIDRLYPDRIDQEDTAETPDKAGEELPASFVPDARAVGAPRDGYLQFFDIDTLVELATGHDLVMRIERRPGHYVTADRMLLLVAPADRCTDEIAAAITDTIIVGNQRTPAQDIEFPISQLVEIAVRALSPGINDPYTAIRCVDRLGSALFRLAQRRQPSSFRFDDDNRLRVLMPPVSFEDVLDAAFNQIRQNASNSAAVSIRLLEVLGIVAEAASRPEDREALGRHAHTVATGACRSLPDASDRSAVQDRLAAANRALGAAGA